MNFSLFKDYLTKVFFENFNNYARSSNISTMLLNPSYNECNPTNQNTESNLLEDTTINLNTSGLEQGKLNKLYNITNYVFDDIGLTQFSTKSLLAGAGLGALAGLSYGYWDYMDSKVRALAKGEKLPDKKKLLIRNTLIGLGIGTTAGSTLIETIYDMLESKKATKKNKETYDDVLNKIMLGNDKEKLRTYLNSKQNGLTFDQYYTLHTIIDSMGTGKKLGGIFMYPKNLPNSNNNTTYLLGGNVLRGGSLTNPANPPNTAPVMSYLRAQGIIS